MAGALDGGTVGVGAVDGEQSGWLTATVSSSIPAPECKFKSRLYEGEGAGACQKSLELSSSGNERRQIDVCKEVQAEDHIGKARLGGALSNLV